MKRSLLALCLSAVFAGAAIGQPNPQAQLNKRFQASGLEVGSAFPAVDIYDASGKPFNTASLKGFTTVVVSGCLT
jgi:cytochrome oxidase Cu insertion factor (SCO1/SenC/PrrC family)